MAAGPRSVLITGSNRGIGLELVRQFTKRASPPHHIFAACRKPDSAKELKELAASHTNLHIVQLDVTDYSRLPSLVQEVQTVVGDKGLNLLINNAALAIREPDGTVQAESLRSCFEVNTVAPIMIIKAFDPLLKQAASQTIGDVMNWERAAVVNISSIFSSCTLVENAMVVAYRTSKTALNMATKSLSLVLKESGVLAVLIHPGWVQTDMGGEGAAVTKQDSVAGIMKVMEGLDASKSGCFLSFKNEILPW